MQLKPGVQMRNVCPQLPFGAAVVDSAFRRIVGHECVVTSITDGEHGAKSLHWMGCAFDVRTRTILPETVAQIAAECIAQLGPDWDIVTETHPPHLHCEWQPKGRP